MGRSNILKIRKKLLLKGSRSDIYPGKVSITNPGTFPFDMTPEDFITTSQPSMKRNPLILDVLYRCRDAEMSGTVFSRMNELCEKAGVRWECTRLHYSFMFSFIRKKEMNTSDLNQEELTAFMIIRNNPRVTRETLSAALGVSIRTSQRITDILVEKNHIKKMGNNRYGYWKIL